MHEIIGSQHQQPSGSKRFGASVLVVSMKLASLRIWLRLLSVGLEEELKVLAFVEWLLLLLLLHRFSHVQLYVTP